MFTRKKYDPSCLNNNINQATKPLEFNLYNGFNYNCTPCMLSADTLGGSKSDVSVSTDLIEVENNLSNRNIISSKCSTANNDKYQVINKKYCNHLLNFDDTRFSHPLQQYREMSMLDLHYTPYIHINPQCHIQDDRIGFDSRSAKYNFVAPKPKLIDQKQFLPKEIKPPPVCKA